MEQRHSLCRMCHVACDLLVTVEDNQAVSIVGDKNNPIYHGFSCIKGRESGRVHRLPSRLLHSQKRKFDGSYEPIDNALATAEIGERLREIVARHGPNAVALYSGTFGSIVTTAMAAGKSLLKAIGSPMYFHTASIDQPGKFIAPAYHGLWLAGTQPVETFEAMLLVGSNPIISMTGPLGPNPARQLKRCLDRGMKLVVVDPRRTEVARKAAIHLQCRPGEDAAILAGIVRFLLKEGLIDHQFVNEETEGLKELAAAVEPLDPKSVAARAGISADDLVAAARIIGSAKAGAASCGTGPNMSGQPHLTEYLSRVTHSLRGWWLRAGQERINPGALVERPPAIAGTPGPQPVRLDQKLRTRDLQESLAGLPTAALPDEILTPGEGQIRALLVIGGNPMVAIPDQLKMHAALKSLDLLVCVDPRLSETARLADYVLAPKLALEVENNSLLMEMNGLLVAGMEYPLPYAQVTPPVLKPPVGADVWEEWEYLYAIAQAMDLELKIVPLSILDPERADGMATAMDMRIKPTTTEMWRMVLKGAPIPYDEVRRSPEGQVFAREKTIVQPRPGDWTGRLQLGSEPMMQELRQIASTYYARAAEEAEYPFRLLCMRTRGTMNSSWRENRDQQPQRRSHNPVFLHPDDLSRMGINDGDVIAVRSRRSTILGVSAALDDLRPGCISMTHGWGTNPDEADDPRNQGGSTSRLVANDVDFDPLTGIPLMSAIPVSVSLVSRSLAAIANTGNGT